MAGKNRRILIVIPYHFYPPKGGGALRCFYAVKELSKYYEVSVITSQNLNISNWNETNIFKQIKFYVAEVNKINYGILSNILPIRFLNFIFFKFYFSFKKTNVNSIFLNFYPALKFALAEVDPDVVIFENLETLSYLSKIVRKHDSKIKIIYEAHNVDHILWRQLAAINNNNELLGYSKSALEIESTLHKYTDCVITVTRQDESILRFLNKAKSKILFSTIECGVDVDEKKINLNINRVNQIPKILFCGSLNYLPNIEGIRWFYENVLPILRKSTCEFEVVIIGNCETLNDFDYLKGDPNIKLIGRVEDVAPYYDDSLFSIVPLLSGSGIRLKITESMSFGCPVISTSLGAEGIAYDENNIIIADTAEQFANSIILLLNDIELREKLSKNGRQLVELKYDWKNLMKKFKEIINSIN